MQWCLWFEMFGFSMRFFCFCKWKVKMKSLVDINYSPGTGKLYLVRQKLLFVQHKKNWNISNLKNMLIAWKVSKYGVFSGPYFPVFGMNTERYEVSLRIQFEYMKIQTRKNLISEDEDWYFPLYRWYNILLLLWMFICQKWKHLLKRLNQ